MTMNLPIENTSFFAQIAEVYCPKVYNDLFDQNLPNPSIIVLLANICIITQFLLITLLCVLLTILFSYFALNFRVFRKTLSRKRMELLGVKATYFFVYSFFCLFIFLCVRMQYV